MSRRNKSVVLKEKNPKQIRVVWILLAVLVIVAIVIFAKGQSRTKENNEEVATNVRDLPTSSFTITQFAPQSHSQMMGYGIITKNKKVVIIDGGVKDNVEEVENFIKKHGGKVDYWFLTHPHSDHVGVFTEIARDENFKIDNIYCSMLGRDWYIEREESRILEFNDFFDTLENRNRIEPSIGDIIKIDDDCEVEILAIKDKDRDEDPFVNNQSMVFKIKGQEESVLILGDTGPKESEFLLYKYEGTGKLNATMIQVAHHGQRGATEELYQEIKPELAFWPTTQWLWLNDSGNGEDSGKWKTKETREWLEKLNVKENVLAFEGEQELDVR